MPKPTIDKKLSDKQFFEQLQLFYNATSGAVDASIMAEQVVCDALFAKYPELFRLVWASHAFFASSIAHKSSQPRLTASQLTNDQKLAAMTLSSACRFMRAADNLFWSGYPYQALCLLRPVRDGIFQLIAVNRGISDFKKLRGVADVATGDDEDAKAKAKANAVKEEENRCYKAILSQTKGLTEAGRSALNTQKARLDTELHRMQMSVASAASLNDQLGTVDLNLTYGPLQTDGYDRPAAMYFTHANAVRMMLIRIIATYDAEYWQSNRDLAQQAAFLSEAHEHFATCTVSQFGAPVGQTMSAAIHALLPWQIQIGSEDA